MSDQLVSGLLQDVDLRIVVATATDLSRHAQKLQSLLPTSAAMLAQALCASAMIAALQKEETSINLQLECDGPLRGLFADGQTQGPVRGYVKNAFVEYKGSERGYEWRPALGNSGFLSVLRDLGRGEHYRSAVELRHFDLSLDLESYFLQSEQTTTFIDLAVVPKDHEVLGAVAGVLIQPLPDGDRAALAELSARLRNTHALRKLLETSSEGAGALLAHLVPGHDLDILLTHPLEFRCTCTKERVFRALLSMGKTELEDMIATEGKAEVTCHFCSAQYLISKEELERLSSEGDPLPK